MKRIFIFAAIVGIVLGMFYLYQKQLGAIVFFLLSIYFFSLAYRQLSKKTHTKDDKEKENGREI